MNNVMCNEHHNGFNAAAAPARADVRSTLAISTSWTFATKPYGDQRPSGASPG